jgi:hypothetical protein
MIGGKIRKNLSCETVLARVDEYNIMSYYLGEPIDLKKRYPSPFRSTGVDNHPNLCFMYGVDGKLIFKDFARGVGGDCFRFVQELFKLNLNQALEKIDDDFGLNIRSGKQSKFKANITERPEPIHKQKLIQIIPRDLTYEELCYWKEYNITPQELKLYNILGIQKLYLNKQLIPNVNKELRFAYVYDQYLKIYSPFSKEYKWISSCPNDYISGFDKIKYKVFIGKQDKRLIITKSLKDQIILSKFFPDVISTQNESTASIHNDDMQVILKGYDPKCVYMAYDNDEAGVKASTYYTEHYGFNYINVPKIFRREGIKDWSDLVKVKDLDTMRNYLKIKNLI